MALPSGGALGKNEGGRTEGEVRPPQARLALFGKGEAAKGGRTRLRCVRYATPRACLAAMRAKVAVRPALMPVKLLG